MKFILHNKLYNTDTAKKVAEIDNGYFTDDMRYFSHTLYLKKTGEYFLFTYGAPMTGFAETKGDRKTYGYRITPFTEELAQKWAMNELDAEQYIELFGEVEE